ncbi:MAG: RNA polymerase sigma-70 factor ECF subfamily [Anaerolineaceae bacterium]|nr:MAG: RNA polymerase sigma-70 factor ECF subfamily [Anaerolineaceae bacterium]
MDENALAQRAAQGDRDAFGELVRLHQAGVYNAAYRMLGERRDAEDAAQEAFVRAFRSIRTLDPSRPPGPWFRKIAVNVCLNRLERREPQQLDDYLPVPSPDPGPEPQAVERERSRQVRAALLTLPPRYRAAIELRAFEELSYAEMAEALGRPLSDVKSDLFRARRMLAKKLSIE